MSNPVHTKIHHDKSLGGHTAVLPPVYVHATSSDKPMQRCASQSVTQGRKLQTIPLRSRSYSCSASSSKSAVTPVPEQVYVDIVKGRRFHCTECGKCCTGRGEVWIDTKDVTRLADRLEIRTQVFLSRYTKSYSRKPGFWLLRSQRNPTQVQSVLAWPCNRCHAMPCHRRPLDFMHLHTCDNKTSGRAHPLVALCRIASS